MRLLDLGRLNRARVWQGELPEIAYAGLRIVEHVVNADRNVVAQPMSGAVEVFFPRGASFHTGLLGARFTPDESGSLRMRLKLVDPAIKDIVDWALAAGVDSVHPGLPPYLVSAVVAGVTTSQDHRSLGSGELYVDCAAFGEVGSAERIFEQLANAVICVCAHHEEEFTAERIRGLFSLS